MIQKAVVTLLGATALAHGNCYYDDYQPVTCPATPAVECCGMVECGLEALLFRPSGCDTGICIQDGRTFNVATQANRLPVGRQCSNNPGYDLGFRIMCGYVFEGGCSDVQIHYLRLHDHTSQKVVSRPGGSGANPAQSGALWVVMAHPRFVSLPLYNAGTDPTLNQLDAECRASSNWDYDAVDLQIGSRSARRRHLHVRSFLGLHWASMERRDEVRYRGTIDPDDPAFARAVDVTYNTKRAVWGMGPRIGVEARYGLMCNFGVAVRMGFSLIAGSGDEHVNESGAITSGLVSSPDVILVNNNVPLCSGIQIIPELDGRFGVNYLWCCNDSVTIVVELGYEFISYVGALQRTTFDESSSSGSGHQSHSCTSFNLNGVYLMARFLF